MLIRAIALGADHAILLTDKIFAGSDTFATSYILSKAIKKLQPIDIYICGGRAVDGETGQVGNGIASRLCLPCLNGVSEILKLDNKAVIVSRQTDTHNEIVQCCLPSLIIFRNFSTKEESLSLMALKRAQKYFIEKWDLKQISADKKHCGQAGSKTKVLNVEQINYGRMSKTINGTSVEKSKFVMDIINNIKGVNTKRNIIFG